MKDNHKADVSHTDEFNRMYQEMVKQTEDKYKVKSEHPKIEEETGLVDNLSSRWVNEFNLPNGYIFKDENGNVINATKIVLEKKKKEYPKTYEECRDLIEGSHVEPFCADLVATGYLSKLMEIFARLIMCRNAYWQLYGEEMGLGEPWEPPYGCEPIDTFCLQVYQNRITKVTDNSANHCILSFPTEEMRDAFYENFEELIESVKELL